MTTYYCDLSLDFADASGVDNSANVLRGVAGMQAAIRGTGAATALVAGDVLKVKGTGKIARLVECVCIEDLSSWQIGDVVRNEVGGGNHWTGLVCESSVDGNATTILIILDTGYTRLDVEINKADGIENVTRAESASISSNQAEGIDFDKNSGTNQGRIKIVGVNSSWQSAVGDTAYCFTLDGESAAYSCFRSTGGKDYLWLENAILTNATGYCLYASYASDDWLIRYVVIENSGGYGTGGTIRNTTWDHCIVRNNGASGLDAGQATVLNCFIYGNGGHGAIIRSGFTVVDSLFVDNAEIGVVDYNAATAIVRCTIDGNGDTGVEPTVDGDLRVFDCRITNNAGYGLGRAWSGSNVCHYENRNLFYNNTLGDRDTGIDTGDESTAAASDVEVGYTDRAGGDYTLTDSAIEAGPNADAITYDWTGTPANVAYRTRGLPKRYLTSTPAAAPVGYLVDYGDDYQWMTGVAAATYTDPEGDADTDVRVKRGALRISDIQGATFGVAMTDSVFTVFLNTLAATADLKPNGRLVVGSDAYRVVGVISRRPDNSQARIIARLER